jgi:pimeloyl-ACP methyl ester carboxylesterase
MNQTLTLAELAQTPEVRSPLGPFAGAKPPAPAWFGEALANAPERCLVETPRGRVEMLTWGQYGKPGLLLIHGNRAHADWWSFIAPFFAEDYRVAAFSLGGMGDSDWRETYGFEGFADDFEAICEAAGLNGGARPPVFVGHSLGGRLVLEYAARRPGRLGAAICIDVGFGEATDAIREIREQKTRQASGRTREQRSRVYPTFAEALANFRLAPPQPLENLYVVDHIARRALKPAPLPDGEGEGWTWKFDIEIYDRLDRAGLFSDLETTAQIEAPVAHIVGARSAFKAGPGVRGPFPEHAVTFEIPEAHHHVPIDQPLALVSAIRGVLTAWRA